MSWTTPRARVAALSRSRTPDDPELIEARRQLKLERITVKIEEFKKDHPGPITDEEADRLSSLLRSGAPATQEVAR